MRDTIYKLWLVASFQGDKLPVHISASPPPPHGFDSAWYCQSFEYVYSTNDYPLPIELLTPVLTLAVPKTPDVFYEKDSMTDKDAFVRGPDTYKGLEFRESPPDCECMNLSSFFSL